MRVTRRRLSGVSPPRLRVALAAAVALGVTASGCGATHSRGAVTPMRPPAPLAAARHHPATLAAPRGWTLIATTKGGVARYAEPGGRPDGIIPATWNGAVSALEVVAQRPGWFEVRLATRPNGSVAWVRRAEVTITSTPYRIVIDLAARHLELLVAGREVLDAPAGIGTPTDPTPTGQFFVALFAASPSPGYGPFVIVTSAHSNAITDWEESGDAIVAFHGPLGADGQIGVTGAAISHGCVRLHDADLDALRRVPAGSPISIIN